MNILNKIKDLFACQDDYSNVDVIDDVIHPDSAVQYNCNILLLSLHSIQKLNKRLDLLTSILDLYTKGTVQYKDTATEIKRINADIKAHTKIVNKYSNKITNEQYNSVLQYV